MFHGLKVLRRTSFLSGSTLLNVTTSAHMHKVASMTTLAQTTMTTPFNQYSLVSQLFRMDASLRYMRTHVDIRALSASTCTAIPTRFMSSASSQVPEGKSKFRIHLICVKLSKMHKDMITFSLADAIFSCKFILRAHNSY